MSSEQVELVPDDAAMWRFVSWWFQGCRRGVIELGWSLPEARAIRHFRRFELEDEALWRFAVEQNRRQSNVYIRVGTIDPDAPLGRTTDEHVRDIPGIQADLDTLEQLASARRVVPILRPLGLVHTGKIPHERMQLYWLFDEPIGDGERARGLNMRLARLLGSDGSVVNPSRLMRLPGGVAWPVKPGRVAELTSFVVPDDGRPRTYPLDHVERQLPVSGALQDEWGGPVGGQASAGPSGALRLSPTATVIEDIRAGRYWHNNVVKLVASWVGRGWSNAEILLASDGLTLAGWTVEQTREEVGKAIGGARRKWGVEEPSGASSLLDGASLRSEPLAVHGLPWDDMEATGMRRWVYGHFLVRGFVSVLGAPGGFGKTAYAQAVALAIVTGQDLLDEGVHEPCRVAVWNLEDPYDEMLRRCWAAVLHHGISRSEVEDRLFLDSGRDRELVIARLDEKGNPVATPDVEQLVAEFKRNNIGAWIPDPLVRLHRLDENDNSQMDFFVATLAQIARDANVAILAPHHFRKGGQGGDADAFRGASAVINAARAAVSLTRMTAEEASGVFKVPEHERWRYLRVENAKLNTAPPPEHAVWLRLVSVALPNGPGGEVGDKVQTVERWYPPSPFEALSMDGMVAALDEIEAGEDGEYFTARRGGKTTRWAGEVLQRHAQQPMSDAQAQGILRRWLESGLLINTTYKSVAQRKVRERVAVDQALKADLTRQTSGGSVSLD